MANVLSDDKRQQVVALGRLGWSLRRIEREVHVRRETASAYLKAAGIERRGHGARPKPATSPEVITDLAAGKPATSPEVITDLAAAKPATSPEVITDPPPTASPTASTCEPYRELITRRIDDGRTAMSIWQELVERHGVAARQLLTLHVRSERLSDGHLGKVIRSGHMRAILRRLQALIDDAALTP